MSSVSADEIPDGHTLNVALKANNLPTYGTKAMKWARLQSGETGKKKPGPKGKATKDPRFEAFSKSQVPGLVAMGIVDDDDQATEIKRRWDAMQKAQSKAGKASPTKAPTKASPTKGHEIRLDQPLDDQQLKSTGLTFVAIDKSGAKPIFVYAKDGASDTKAKSSPAPAKKATPSKSPALKRKKTDEEEDEEDEEEDDLDWACEVSKERLLKRCRKETLQAMCSDFGVPTSGSKEQLADMLSEQLHAETDDEADEEDDE